MCLAAMALRPYHFGIGYRLAAEPIEIEQAPRELEPVAALTDTPLAA